MLKSFNLRQKFQIKEIPFIFLVIFNVPKEVPDCGRLAGIPNREKGESWWVQRW
jgi:hypothetical protein